jgi:hypothetical protein
MPGIVTDPLEAALLVLGGDQRLFPIDMTGMHVVFTRSGPHLDEREVFGEYDRHDSATAVPSPGSWFDPIPRASHSTDNTDSGPLTGCPRGSRHRRGAQRVVAAVLSLADHLNVPKP